MDESTGKLKYAPTPTAVVLLKFEGSYSQGPGCWIWQGSRNPDGYGHIIERLPDRKRRFWAAHRVAWFKAYGPIPASLSVLHRCDVRACVRPTHLWLGTQRENISDMDRKGRRGTTKGRSFVSMPGESNPRAKLTAEGVRAIRERYARGERQTALAREYGVSQAVISAVVLGKAWR